MQFLTNMLHILGVRSPDESLENLPLGHYPVASPQRARIIKEPLLAVKNGQMVMVLDHAFDGVPAWVEWDPEDQMFSITHIDGAVDRVRTAIKREYLQTLIAARKLLLVSKSEQESHDQKIMHFVPFLSRG